MLPTHLLLALVANAHPPSTRPDPLPSQACEAGNVTFFSYHAHVVFEDGNRSVSRDAAMRLQRDFAEAFAIDVEVDPVACDDSNTTHGMDPPLCMIDADYGPLDPEHGHWGSPACPFKDAEWAVFVPAQRYLEVMVWFAQHRGILDVMLHPNSGCEVYDHRDWPVWAGERHDLDLTCLHYDCPGCASGDCRARGERVVLSHMAETCGLVLDASKQTLELSDEASFCEAECQHWARVELATWAAECPYNCDIFVGKQANTCSAHLSSFRDIAKWSLDVCDESPVTV